MRDMSRAATETNNSWGGGGCSCGVKQGVVVGASIISVIVARHLVRKEISGRITSVISHQQVSAPVKHKLTSPGSVYRLFVN